MEAAKEKGVIPGLSKNALTVLEKRYLKRNKEGKILETAVDMFQRVAATIAAADRNFDNNDDPPLVTAAASLGKFNLPKGKLTTVTVSNKDTDGFVVADGLQCLPVR
jgi:ribonucleotide reductase alpha subunit